ncbi:hypothetical protein A3F37_04370 [Candidatus Saccharibacteria bacterium RIFCSPHIGHO2_12_FULL_41_12]|nr:MAG: hypothetical protein A3F37_04370 [Candidatus Saccharibacteria bacterium RIFCSPHIGHO2_12_FULL_41_12]
MCEVCPTVTAFDIGEYNRQMRVNTSFAKRIHVDLMDGVFAPSKSPNLCDIWLPQIAISDIHLMYQKPHDYLEELIRLRPNMVIIHAEADAHHMHFAAELHKEGIKAGLAVLADTSIESVERIMHSFDQILVFSGNLGYQGGSAVDLSLLRKADYVKEHHPEAELAWDGGISDQNAKQLADGGIDVLNTGGYIQKADNPQANYNKIMDLISGSQV